MFRLGLVLGLLLLANSPALPADEEVVDPELDEKVPFTLHATWQGHSKEEIRLALLKKATSYYSYSRAVAAVGLSGQDDPQTKAILESLLLDPDPLVARLAAESFYGVEHYRDEALATRYKYKEVLAAEAKAKEILGKLPDAEAKAAFVLTRELIALGMPALIEVAKHVKSPRPEMVLMAKYTWQEIGAAASNVPPLWGQEIHRKLESKISFEFKDTPMVDALVELSKKLDFTLRMAKDALDSNTTISLRVTDFPAKDALRWVLLLAERDQVFQNGALEMTRKSNVFVDGITRVILDVRDLEESDKSIDWKAVIEKDIPDTWDRLGPFGAVPITVQKGWLIIMAPYYGGNSDGRYGLKPLVEYLNRKREAKGLEKIAWPIGEP